MSEEKKYKYFHRVIDVPQLVAFKTSCECLEPKHDLMVEFEYDDELKMVSLQFCIYCNLRTKRFQCMQQNTNFFKSFIKMLWERITTSFKVLFSGYLELDEAFIFKNQEQQNELCDIIQTFTPEVQNRGETMELLRKRVKTLENRLGITNGTH